MIEGLTGIAALEAEMRDRLAAKNAEIERLLAQPRLPREASDELLRAMADKISDRNTNFGNAFAVFNALHAYLASSGTDPFCYAKARDGGWCVRGPKNLEIAVGDKNAAYMLGKLLSGKTEDAAKMAADFVGYMR